VSKIVEANPGQVLHATDKIGELVSKAGGLFGFAILASTD
jgi:hypothetical protein